MASLPPAFFTDDQVVTERIAGLAADVAHRGSRLSDICDDEGNQYVDLVMEGGGVLGIALAGYLHTLEAIGVRFLSVAGTSAGAITALLLAASDRPDQPKAHRILEHIGNLDMFSFVDGGPAAKRLSRAASRGSFGFFDYISLLAVTSTITEHFALNPGIEFTRWLERALESHSIGTVGELGARMRPRPGTIYHRVDEEYNTSADDITASLRVVAADVTTGSKAILPDMAPLYWAEPENVNPALLVRASMSVPGFFRPMRVSDVPRGQGQQELWSDRAGYSGRIPEEVLFVDGGIISNFPIDLFHKPGYVPRMPTLGAKLGRPATEPRNTSSLFPFLGNVFGASRRSADQSFIIGNPDFRRLVSYIDTDSTGVHWLNFSLDSEEKLALFRVGVRAACEFVRGFDWEEYKRVRAELLELSHECRH